MKFSLLVSVSIYILSLDY